MQQDDPKLRVISALYDAVADGAAKDGAAYEPMFFAMDDIIEQVLEDTTHPDPANTLSKHFDRAAHIFDILSREETETPVTFVARRTMATAVLDHGGRILARNDAFVQELGDRFEVGCPVMEAFASPADEARFTALARANATESQSIINITLPDTEAPLSLLVGHVARMSPPALYAAPIRPRWSDRIGALLQQGFELSQAEIDTLRSFIETGSVAGVAQARGRSIRTVRTQLSRVFAQMGISGQTELALFLATLGGLEASVSAPRPQTDRASSRVRSQVLTLQGHRTEVVSYGDPKGLPVLLIQSTHPPVLTEPLRQALHAEGLHIIAPLKPGSGESAPIKGRPGPAEMAPLYAELLDALGIGEALVAGQASGGLYALAFARQFPERARNLALIDTGVPFRGRMDLMRLPKGIRRTMVPARYFPDLLYLPHRLVAANFRRSRKGEANVVDYFFADSTEENHLTRTDVAAYEVTREIIRYSFDDTDRLVDDISRWAQDWSSELKEVLARQRIAFLHGTSNQMFRLDNIARWAGEHGNVDVVEMHPGGQLAAFRTPSRLAQALREIASAGR